MKKIRGYDMETILKESQKFKVTNLNVNWYSMGITMEEWNDNDYFIVKVINGELYLYD